MGKTIVHAGGPGNGQAAKICNNMILGMSMIAVSEAFVLAEKLGLDHQKLFDISSKSSGQCWSMTTYCPVPGPVPTSPANRDYQAGLHRRDDAQGSQALAGCGKGDANQNRTWRRCRAHLFPICGKRRGGARFFRHHSFCSRVTQAFSVNEALARFCRIVRSTERSPSQINLIFMVLFKPILDCALLGCAPSGTGKTGPRYRKRTYKTQGALNMKAVAKTVEPAEREATLRPYPAALS